MFKNHPKGLFVAFFSNMGERFGWYTMLSILSLFIQAKYGFTSAQTTLLFSVFTAVVYLMPLFGGMLADRVLGYGKSITIGLVMMMSGYVLISVPTPMNTGLYIVLAGMFIIAAGTGFFKGNLQTLVGNLYDNPLYSKNRDSAFNIFYMGINLGAMFAPFAASSISNLILKKYKYTLDSNIPALSHDLINNNLNPADTEKLLSFAQKQDATVTIDTLKEFCLNYVNALSASYHWAFAAAGVSMVISIIVYLVFKKYFKDGDITEREKKKAQNSSTPVIEMSASETKQRFLALIMVFTVVIFFWMSFQQSGAIMTLFARDYTIAHTGKITYLWFDIFGLIPIFLSILGLYFLVKPKTETKWRIAGLVGFVVFAIFAYYRFTSYDDVNYYNPEEFQQFNPFFIVALTPIVIAIFEWLNKKNIEPSAPKKIAIGMLITAIAFFILVVGSFGLPSPLDLNEKVAPENMLVSPYWLISTYLILTIAELFLSPIGISFVTKVSPPKYKGMMMGGWFVATAIGNQLIGLIGYLYGIFPLWLTWAVLVACCLTSAFILMAIMKRLEKATAPQQTQI